MTDTASKQCNNHTEQIAAQKRTEEALRETNTRLELLSDTASKLLMTDDPQGLVQSLCENVMKKLDCHVFFNYLVSEEHGCLHLNAFAGIPEEIGKKIEWLTDGTAVCGCVARDGCRIVAEDIANTPDPRTNLVKSFGVQAYACHPLLSRGGKVIGTLSFGSRSKIRFTDDELALMKAITDQVATAMERKRADEAQRELEAHKLEFYRRTILAATDGKLVISEKSEIDSIACNLVASWNVEDYESLSEMRDEAILLANKEGMLERRTMDFLGCIVEAATNATKHAGGGEASLCRNGDSLIYIISDSGPGIGAMALPDVALTRGYSTAGTLGMGYKVMLKFADKVYLSTGPEGTTVAIKMALHPNPDHTALPFKSLSGWTD